MDAGTLIVLLLIVGGVFLLFSMHRGGHAHGGAGGGCCGGHSHDKPSPDERQTPHAEEKQPLLGKPGSHSHTNEPATAGGGRHRGC